MTDYIHGNHLRLLYNGSQYFPALIRALHAARREILLESYIFELDTTGIQVAMSLIHAAERGVEVRLLLDGFGSLNFPQIWRARMERAGIRLLFFRPQVRWLSFERAQLRRLHRKLCVVDGVTGFVGGINIIDDTNHPQSGLPPRYDYAVEVAGPLVVEIHAAMDRQWRHTAWTSLQRDWARRSHVRPVSEKAGHTAAKLVIRDNVRHRRDIELEYLQAIQSARHEILIANAYFLPGRRLRRALLAAAARGVRVALILQGRVDNLVMHYASQAFYRQLLKGGVALHEFTETYMHAKVATIDGRWSTVGSSNIDPLSLLLAREANVVVRDMAFAAQLRADLRRVLAQKTRAITLSDIKHAGLWRRLLQWLCFGLVRLAMGLTGYGGKSYLR